MTGLLLATLLPLSPGIQLIDNVEARHLALSDVRFHPLRVSDDAQPPPTFDQMSREQLRAELRRLDETRPSLGGPIAMLSVALALIIPGIPMTAIGVTGLVASARGAVVGWTLASGILTGVGFVIVTAGIILAIVGGVTLGVRLKARSESGRAADEVRRRLEALDPGQPLPVPPAEAPAPPPQANFVVPGPSQTVLTF
ncbi:MAG: hypothetical protein H6Q89_980 [Myxococcaceae bacterium]|nr:hypothetical protein [Myxococcaceae bacterium]